MAIVILVPKYRRNPNEKVDALYYGVANGGTTVTTLVKPSQDRNRMEATRVYGAGLERGQGGRIAILVLGGMETTLDEMEYIMEAKRQKKFVPHRTGKEIADLCRLLLERRNDLVKFYRKNPSEKPRKRKVRLYLPRGYQYIPTAEPGLQVLVKA